MQERYQAQLFSEHPVTSDILTSGVNGHFELNVAINKTTVDFWQNVLSYTSDLLITTLNNPIESVGVIINDLSDEINSIKEKQVNVTWDVSLVSPLRDNSDKIYDLKVYEINWENQFSQKVKSNKFRIDDFNQLNNLFERLTDNRIFIATVTTYKSYLADHYRPSLNVQYYSRSKSNMEEFMTKPTVQKSYEDQYLGSFEELRLARDFAINYQVDEKDLFQIIRMVKYYDRFLVKRKEFEKLKNTDDHYKVYLKYFSVLENVFLEEMNSLRNESIATAINFVQLLHDFRIDSSATLTKLHRQHHVLSWYEGFDESKNSFKNDQPFLKANEMLKTIERRIWEEIPDENKLSNDLQKLENLKNEDYLRDCNYCYIQIDQQIKDLQDFENYKKLLKRLKRRLYPKTKEVQDEIYNICSELDTLDRHELFFLEVKNSIESNLNQIKKIYVEIAPDVDKSLFKDLVQKLKDEFVLFDEDLQYTVNEFKRRSINCPLTSTKDYLLASSKLLGTEYDDKGYLKTGLK